VVRADPVAMSSSSAEEQLVGRKATKEPVELKSTSLFLSHGVPITAVARPGWPRAEKHSRDEFCKGTRTVGHVHKARWGPNAVP